MLEKGNSRDESSTKNAAHTHQSIILLDQTLDALETLENP